MLVSKCGILRDIGSHTKNRKTEQSWNMEVPAFNPNTGREAGGGRREMPVNLKPA